jgi:uncharacterized protein
MKRFLVGAFAAAALLASVPAAAQTPQMRVCTGKDTGNYYFAANVLKKHSTRVAIIPMETGGSLDNIEKIIAGECDAAFVQNDALRVASDRNARVVSAIERGTTMYKEYAHLLCNRSSGITRVTHLTDKHTVAIGPQGSGSAVTWSGFVAADRKKYGTDRSAGQRGPTTDPRDGIRAFNAAADGAEVTCALFVGGLGSALIKGDAAKLANNLILVNVDDSDFDDEVDARGRKIYTFETIPGKTYGALSPSGIFSYKDVSTVAVQAVFVVSTEWLSANNAAYDSVLSALNTALPEVLQRVEPK